MYGFEKLIFMDLVSNKFFVIYLKGDKLKLYVSDFELMYLFIGKVIDKDN